MQEPSWKLTLHRWRRPCTETQALIAWSPFSFACRYFQPNLALDRQEKQRQAEQAMAERLARAQVGAAARSRRAAGNLLPAAHTAV